VDAGVLRFAEYQMDTAEKRKRVYYSWVVFRKLTFNMRKIAYLIRSRKIQITIIVGRHDKIITSLSMNVLRKHLPKHDFHVLESGHHGLIQLSRNYF
jgi:pimeloyl-ACP methyl ester carboxylesterase